MTRVKIPRTNTIRVGTHAAIYRCVSTCATHYHELPPFRFVMSLRVAQGRVNADNKRAPVTSSVSRTRTWRHHTCMYCSGKRWLRPAILLCFVLSARRRSLKRSVCDDLSKWFQSGHPCGFGRQAASQGRHVSVDSGDVGDELVGLVEQGEIPLSLFREEVGQSGCGSLVPADAEPSNDEVLVLEVASDEDQLQRHRPFPWMTSSLARGCFSMALGGVGYQRTVLTRRWVVLPRGKSSSHVWTGAHRADVACIRNAPSREREEMCRTSYSARGCCKEKILQRTLTETCVRRSDSS